MNPLLWWRGRREGGWKKVSPGAVYLTAAALARFRACDANQQRRFNMYVMNYPKTHYTERDVKEITA